jgi:VWFA-related protein
MSRAARWLVTFCTVVAGAVCVGDAQQPQAPAQNPPVFRGEVDVIQLDVSVLDKERRPIRGLTAADFTVLENGKPQRIVAVSQIDAVENDPPPTSWMRHVPKDVVANDLSDELGDGRLYAVVMDDVNLPWDDVDIVMSARQVGQLVVDQLGPSDMAAVVFPRDAGLSQDFTSDRDKLSAAVARFNPEQPPWLIQRTPFGPGPGGGDMPQRFSPVLTRSMCMRSQPAVPALDAVVGRLASVPKRRKTLIFVSSGIPLRLGGCSDSCQCDLSEAMKDVFRKAQRANVNIYGVDPTGFRGSESYALDKLFRGGGSGAMEASRGAQGAARVRRDFLDIMAENTGGRALVNVDSIETEIGRIFDEDSSYYIVGYQTANPNPDGKFRRIQVKVGTRDATVRTRSGYWGARDGRFATAEQNEAAPSTLELSLSGMMAPPGLPLRVSVLPVALAPPRLDAEADPPRMTAAVVLTVREPTPRAPLDETLTVVRNLYDADDQVSAPVQQITHLTLEPQPSDEAEYNLLSRFDLAPGRYQVRLNVHSRVLDQGASVYADVEVPDVAKRPLSLSGVVLGAALGSPRTDPLVDVVPIVPTSSRSFAPSDHVSASLRVFQGAGAPIAPATLAIQVRDSHDQAVFETTSTIDAASFDAQRSAPWQFEMPVSGLGHGPHLLSVTATLPGGATVRRDLVFRMR